MNVIDPKPKNLTAEPPSDEWTKQLRSSAAAFAGPGHPLASCFYADSWKGRQASHPIYSVGLHTIIDAKDLTSVNKPFCWRFLAGGHREMAMAAGCLTTHEVHGLPAKVMAVLPGKEMKEVLDSVEQLSKLPEVKDNPSDKYDVRVLRIPALYMEAFWLKSESPQKEDLIVPYGLLLNGNGGVKFGTQRPLRKDHAYLVTRFLDTIRDAAQKRLAAGSSMGPPG